MLFDIVSMLYSALSTGYSWFEAICIKFGFFPVTLFLSIVTISAVFKFILSPYLTGSSDSAKISKGRRKNK